MQTRNVSYLSCAHAQALASCSQPHPQLKDPSPDLIADMAEPTSYKVDPSPDQAAYPQQQQDPNPNPPQGQANYPPAPPEQGYLPQQQGYPPQQQGYPLQQQGYPPQQQQGYPPQQQGYPPQQQQQQGYNEKQPYPPQAYPQQPYTQQGAPPYFADPQVQQQAAANVVVVQQQPTVVVTSTPVRRYGTGDHGLIYAIVASVCILFIGVWCSLMCTIPAIFVAISAQDAENRGDETTMRSQTQTSIVLTSVGVFFSVGFWIAYIIFIVLL